MNPSIEKLWRIVKDKYFLVTVFFFAWIFFFAQNDVITQIKQKRELNEMKEKVSFLESEISRMKKERELLLTDSTVVEKLAREKYLMKKGNEEVFVFDTLAEVKK